ncbi:hypothetical protein [Flavobacterium sp. 7A]|uniref:hypothetical protein n=1 Tax=Flavobacterium sp. 7A TaxID=2940571 RepID=UPI002227E85A|nr:hypothetical protein [Flavobacterium sp. 7A]MCW2118531.1 glutaredoxin [Flavobacterium sp. 7A]
MKLKYLMIASSICLFTSCSSSKKITSKYKTMNLSELENKKDSIDKQLSYSKLAFYLENIKVGKSRYSLAAQKDKNLLWIMHESPNYENLKEIWQEAVEEYIAFENEYSPQIKKHRSLNYKNKEKSLSNRNEYNKIYLPLLNELKHREYEKYIYYEKNFSDKLANMWYDGGSYLLNFYKSKNLEVPTVWLNDKDIFGIENFSNYNELRKHLKYINKAISTK